MVSHILCMHDSSVSRKLIKSWTFHNKFIAKLPLSLLPLQNRSCFSFSRIHGSSPPLPHTSWRLSRLFVCVFSFLPHKPRNIHLNTPKLLLHKCFQIYRSSFETLVHFLYVLRTQSILFINFLFHFLFFPCKQNLVKGIIFCCDKLIHTRRQCNLHALCLLFV